MKAKGLKIVTGLGGFLALLSFIASLGITMEGSSLEKALKTLYGPNTVTRIFSGKAISRALRAYFLVDSALTVKFISSFFPKSRNFMLTDEEGEDLARDNSVPESQILSADESMNGNNYILVLLRKIFI